MIKLDKNIISFMIFFYFFIFRDVLEQKISVFGYVDELLALIAIPIFIYQLITTNQGKLKISSKGYSKYIILLVILGLISNIKYKYQPFKAVLLDLLLVTKFWLSIYTGKHLLKGVDINKYANNIYFHIKLVTCLFAILTLLNNIGFNIFPSQIRYGLKGTQLFYFHPTVFVATCTFLIAILFSIYTQVEKAKGYLITLLILICTSLVSKGFGMVALALLIYYTVYKKYKKIKLSTIIVALPLLIFVAWDKIQFYFIEGMERRFARPMLLVEAINIANNHFPLGGGFGTYGSYVSAQYYSPLYINYGLSDVHGLAQKDPSFVSDSFWPMILGQFGWIGLILFILALVFLIDKIQEMFEINIAYYASGISILGYLIISSTAESAFVHPFAIPLGIWLGVLFKNYERERIKQY